MAIANMKVTVSCPIDTVFDKVTDLNDSSWRSDLADIRIIDANNFVEISKEGIETHFKVTEYIKDQTLAFEIENENIKGTWTGRFSTQEGRTTLDFTEDIVAKAFIFKPLVGLYLRRQQALYFKDLFTALGV